MGQLREKFNLAVQNGMLSLEILEEFRAYARDNEVEEYVRGSIGPDAKRHLESMLDAFRQQNMISSQQENLHNNLCDCTVDPFFLEKTKEDLQWVKLGLQIKRGELPIVDDPGIPLEIDETCHLETDVEFRRNAPTTNKRIHGRLIATNRKIRFIHDGGGWEILYRKVISIASSDFGRRGDVVLRLLVNRGNGYYHVSEPQIVVDILNKLLKDAQQHSQSMSGNRRDFIPEDVRISVWRRDNGCCAKCGSKVKLEFDHIIPVSKGGSSTARNLQLLWERCNREKGARIA